MATEQSEEILGKEGFGIESEDDADEGEPEMFSDESDDFGSDDDDIAEDDL